MDDESHSTGTSAVASALASGATSPAEGVVPVNPKSAGLLESAVPMENVEPTSIYPMSLTTLLT